jgi:putative YhdH/YhfP family quinone oxidoreductase
LPEGEVLIKVAYSSLNHTDAMSASGHRGVTKRYPHTPGIDAAGCVVSDSSGRFRRGDKVVVTGYDLGMNTAGGLAQLIRVPACWLVPLPDTLSLREAMIYGTAGLTAALCMEKLLRMGASPEDGVVAVTGATGGVGSMAIALLAQQGFEVAAITGKLESSEDLARLGAKQVIDRSAFDEMIDRPLVSPQWAHAIDCLGGDYLFGLAKSLAYGGSVAACGLSAASEFKANVYPFVLRGINLLGVDSVELPLPLKIQVWEKLADAYRPPRLSSMASEITLAQVPQHLDQLLNGHAVGRYLVKL